MGWPSALECRGGSPAPQARLLGDGTSSSQAWGRMLDVRPWARICPSLDQYDGHTRWLPRCSQRVVKWVGLRGTQEP